jgi:hypothetical protein
MEPAEEKKDGEIVESAEPGAAAADGEEPEVDAAVYEKANDLVETTDEQKFTCSHPQDRGGHIVYKCKGYDAQGVWEGDRRYNEFWKLREKLELRWPGIPFPLLPPKNAMKKALGNKDLKFINERRFYLERFLKKMAGFGFIIDSPEFMAFSRPNGDVNRALDTLSKPLIPDVVERMRVALKIEDHMYNPLQKDKLDLTCKQFQHFAKQILPILQEMQKTISYYM